MDEKRQFNLYLSEDLIRRVKHAAIDAGQRLSDYVADVLERHLAEQLANEEGKR
jgi:predicted DNA binding CopG/RHH family protein